MQAELDPQHSRTTDAPKSGRIAPKIDFEAESRARALDHLYGGLYFELYDGRCWTEAAPNEITVRDTVAPVT